MRYDMYVTSWTSPICNSTDIVTDIRPDPGGSYMPWLPTLLLLFLHLPACVIRAIRWESGQYLVCESVPGTRNCANGLQ